LFFISCCLFNRMVSGVPINCSLECYESSIHTPQKRNLTEVHALVGSRSWTGTWCPSITMLIFGPTNISFSRMIHANFSLEKQCIFGVKFYFFLTNNSHFSWSLCLMTRDCRRPYAYIMTHTPKKLPAGTTPFPPAFE
jgi:hypothetical protein